MTAQEAPTTYTFGRRDRGGLLLGFKASQLMVMAGGFGAVLLGLVTAGSRGGTVGLVVLFCAGFVALYPIQGMPAVDWIRPIINHVRGRAHGAHVFLGGRWSIHRTRGMPRIDLPGLGQRLRCYTVIGTRGPIAILRMDDRWTVIVEVRGSNYVLADRATQERRITAWGALLSQAGQEGSHIAAVQWLERTIPDSGQELADWWQARGDHESPYADTYAELIAGAGPAATRHESFIAVSIDAHKLRRPIRQAGGGPDGTGKVLLNELAWIKDALGRAEIEVLGDLTPPQLARLVRTQYDPAATLYLDRRPRPIVVPDVTAGPMAAQTHWDHYRSDSGFHAVFWIAEWPAVPVEAAWIYPLIAAGGVRRTVSVTCEPIPPSRSLRELRSQRVAKRADDAQRRRLGQVETAQDDEEYAAIERRERELVRGHTEYRFTGWITVTAADRDQLEAACAQMEQAAVRSALEVRRVYGEVDQAFLLGALPLTQGVRR